MDALGAPHSGERSEAQLIRDFIEKIGQLRPQLVVHPSVTDRSRRAARDSCNYLDGIRVSYGATKCHRTGIERASKCHL
jgi:hypothetical protein